MLVAITCNYANYTPIISCGTYNSSTNTFNNSSVTWSPSSSGYASLWDVANPPPYYLNGAVGTGQVTNPTPVPAGRTLQARLFVTGQGTFNAAPLTCTAPPPTPTQTPVPTATPIPTQPPSSPTPTPIVPVCPTPVLNSPANGSCTNSPPQLSATRSGLADQVQFGVDDAGVPYMQSPWAYCTSGWLSPNNPATYSCFNTTETDTYYWSARAKSSTNACTLSSLAQPRSYDIDITAPETPSVATASYNNLLNNVTFSWTPSNDVGCANCLGKAAKY